MDLQPSPASMPAHVMEGCWLAGCFNLLARLWDRPRNVACCMGTILKVLPSLQALGSWQDPIATTIYMAALLGIAFLVFVLGLSTVLAFALFWIVRPPRLRTPTPAPPANFFRRLPSRADRIM